MVASIQFHQVCVFITNYSFTVQTISILGNGYIELGAQWIHGQEDNVLYNYAEERGLVSDPFADFGTEGIGSFCCEDGTLANCDMIEELIASLDKAKEIDMHSKDVNMYEYFQNTFNNFIISKSNLSDQDHNLLKLVFRWFIIFEVISHRCLTFY